MNINILITAIAPVIFIIVLGFAAGVRKDFSIAEAKGFSRLALRYALPVALFLGMARFDRDLLLQQGPIVVIMVVGYSSVVAVRYARVF